MRLYIDLDSNAFVSDPAFKSRVPSVDFKRGDASEVVLSFVSGNTVTPLVSGALVEFGIKKKADYSGDFLVFSDEYILAASSYVLNPSFNTDTLNALLSSNATGSIDTILEVTFSEDDGSTWKSSNTITARIFNDVIKGSEGTPTELPSPDDWLNARAVRYDEGQELTTEQQEQARSNIGIITDPTPLATNAAKLLYAATPGEKVEITEEGGRIEMFLGGDASDDDRWAVIIPTIALSIVYTEGAGDSLTVGEEVFDGDTSEARFVGWFRPDAIPVQSSMVDQTFVLGAVIIDYDTPTDLTIAVDKNLTLSGSPQFINTIITVRPRSSVALSFA
jgi:hypothetical protein